MPAPEAISLLLAQRERRGVPLIDVRSEGEFADGSLPFCVNLPILTNPERHQVGITYKRDGQAQAVELGHRLVNPHRSARVQAWSQVGGGPLTVFCWRGGMRSQIAAQWIRESGREVQTVQGGYKAIRKTLLAHLSGIHEQHPRRFVIGGLTGSGKTDLIGALKERAPTYPVLDLEELARHRGSSFGGRLQEAQPTQASFENALGLELARFVSTATQTGGRRDFPLVVEDESPMIGRVHVGAGLRSIIQAGPLVVVHSSLEERAERIHNEYVKVPLASGISQSMLHQHLGLGLARLRSKLGGEKEARIRQLLDRSASHGFQESDHEQEWIQALLTDYYDKLYAHSTGRLKRKTAFEGSIQECLHYLTEEAPTT